MTPNEYQKKAHETASYPYGTIGEAQHTVDYLYPAMGLSEEAGEVSGKFAKAIRDNDGVIDEERKREIIKELGDVCWYIALACNVLGVSFEEVMETNINKLNARYSSGSFTVEEANNKKEGDI